MNLLYPAFKVRTDMKCSVNQKVFLACFNIEMYILGNQVTMAIFGKFCPKSGE